MISSLKDIFFLSLGSRIKEKIIVFESDDWGMIRTPSIKSYNNLLKKGYPLDKCTYSKNDSIERNIDLEGLMDVLIKNKTELSTPIFTINNVLANPDFNFISENNFEIYKREPFWETYRKYPQTNNLEKLYEKAIDNKLFNVQFHGTEHVNVNVWMKELKKRNNSVIDAFNERMSTIHQGWPASCHTEYLDTYGCRHNEEFLSIDQSLIEGVNLFKLKWGKAPISFIAPCYSWPKSIERELYNLGIRYIQGNRVQKDFSNGILKKRYHFLNQSSKESGMRYLVRNCRFEPSDLSVIEPVDQCLKEIDQAFKFNKPAVICSHRLNFIGRLHESNRDLGLKSLDKLLRSINKKWPDVRYMSTEKLGAFLNG